MKKTIIDRSNFIRGIGATDLDDSAGMSPQSAGFNFFKEQYADFLMPSPYGDTNSGAGILGEVCAVVKNETQSSTVGQVVFVDRDSRYYALDSGNIGLKKTDATANVYSPSVSRMVVYKDEFYTSSDRDVTKANSALTTLDEDWWSSIESNLTNGYPHSLVVTEGILYIADKNAIHIWDGTSSQEDALLFGDDIVITEMIEHPNGRDMIVFAQKGGLVTSRDGQSIVYYVDLLTMEFYYEKDISYRVNVARLIDDTIYVSSIRSDKDSFWGIFDGKNVTRYRTYDKDTTSFAYSALFSKFGGFLLTTADGQTDRSIIAHGDVAGEKKFFKPWRKKYLSAQLDNIECIQEIDESKIFIVKFEEESEVRISLIVDFSEETLTNLYPYRFFSNRIKEATNSWIRRLDISLEDELESGQSFKIFIENFSATGDPATQIGTVSFASDGAIRKKRFACNIFTEDYQVFLEPNGTVEAKVKKIEIYSEGEE